MNARYLRPGDMAPAEIRYRLSLKGWKQSSLARKIDRHPSSIYQVIEGNSSSEYVMRAISDIIGIPIEIIRPSQYLRPKKRGRPFYAPPLSIQ